MKDEVYTIRSVSVQDAEEGSKLLSHELRIEQLESIVGKHEKALARYSPAHCEQCGNVHWKKNK
jgi:hypothetical protein